MTQKWWSLSQVWLNLHSIKSELRNLIKFRHDLNRTQSNQSFALLGVPKWFFALKRVKLILFLSIWIKAVGTNSMISRLFTLCVPFIGSMAYYWQPLPMVALGVPTVLAGILALALPETSGRDLPQTIYEANQIEMSFSTSKSFKDVKTWY